MKLIINFSQRSLEVTHIVEEIMSTSLWHEWRWACKPTELVNYHPRHTKR